MNVVKAMEYLTEGTAHIVHRQSAGLKSERVVIFHNGELYTLSDHHSIYSFRDFRSCTDRSIIEEATLRYRLANNGVLRSGCIVILRNSKKLENGVPLRLSYHMEAYYDTGGRFHPALYAVDIGDGLVEYIQPGSIHKILYGPLPIWTR